jgi:flagellar biosynthesis protein FliQ
VLRVAVLNTLVALIVIMTISWLWTIKAITSKKNSLIPKIICVLCIIGEFATVAFGAIKGLF